MPASEDLGGTLGQIKALADTVKAVDEAIVATVNLLQGGRSVVLEVDNTTDRSLRIIDDHHDSGKFAKPPSGLILPKSNDVSGSESDGIMTGTVGDVTYAIDDGTNFKIHWANPYIGSNSCGAETFGPNSENFRCYHMTGAGNKGAQMRYVLFEIKQQSDWRFCVKCHTLFFNGPQSLFNVVHQKTGCPIPVGAHTPHDKGGSWNFALDVDTPGLTHGQSEWRPCVKCGVLFFNGYPEKGVCPAGGSHDQGGSWNFNLQHDLAESPSHQSEWRFCVKCFALFYDGFHPGGVRDVFELVQPRCPTGGGHDKGGSWNFCLKHVP